MRYRILAFMAASFLLPSLVGAQPTLPEDRTRVLATSAGDPVDGAHPLTTYDSTVSGSLITLLTAFVAPGALGMPALAFGVMGWDGTNVRLLSVSATGILTPATSTATAALYDPDQLDAITFAAAATRKTITCQVVGTTQVLVREGAATGGVCCHRFNGGAVANDGTGQWFEVTSSSAVYLYDVAGAGNADVACTFEVYP